jgi:hypothetical protein
MGLLHIFFVYSIKTPAWLEMGHGYELMDPLYIDISRQILRDVFKWASTFVCLILETISKIGWGILAHRWLVIHKADAHNNRPANQWNDNDELPQDINNIIACSRQQLMKSEFSFPRF